MLKKYKIGFNVWALGLFIIVMIPNCIWFAVPAPNDILRAESVTKIPDMIASISQAIMLVALCVFKNINYEKQKITRFLLTVILNCILYFIFWIFYYLGVSNTVIILGMTIFPCLAFLFFAIDRKNMIAIIPMSVFMICHLIHGIVNYII